jgi:hypothetical protein
MIRRVTKDGLVDSDGYLLNDDGERIKKYNPFKLDIRDFNIVQTYYWFYDLRGRLKQEIKPPGEYHGRPRAFVQEDIEEDRERNILTSHLRYYLGKKIIAYTTMTVPELEIRFVSSGYEDAGSRPKVVQMIRFLLDGGWSYYKVESRKRKKQSQKIKRLVVKSKKTPVKKKRVVKRGK